MIVVHFRLGGDMVQVAINGNSLLFSNTTYGSQYAPINGLVLSKAGVIKEFPDLADNPFWRDEAINRFKAHLSLLQSEDHKADYIIQDLAKHGYQAILLEKAGFRPRRLYGTD